jgi:transcriptional regulator with XRE-family HTH domain
MEVEISRALKLLRHERGESQRQAAEGLKVSQALLSHYENGAREPGLKFVCRACDYYGVSADYMLGRAMTRDGQTIENLYDAAEDKDNRLRGSASALISKKLLVNSVSVIFDTLGKVGHKGLTADIARYLNAAVYKTFRILYSSGKNNPGFFSLPETVYAAAADAEMAVAEAKAREVMASGEADVPPLSHADLQREYPMTTQSLLSVLHQSGENMKKFF